MDAVELLGRLFFFSLFAPTTLRLCKLFFLAFSIFFYSLLCVRRHRRGVTGVASWGRSFAANCSIYTMMASRHAIRDDANETRYKKALAKEKVKTKNRHFIIPPDHPLLDSAPNLGPLISRWEIIKFKNSRYWIVRILDVLKLLFQQFLNLSSSKRDMSGPKSGDLSNNRWSGGNISINNARQIRRWCRQTQSRLLSWFFCHVNSFSKIS